MEWEKVSIDRYRPLPSKLWSDDIRLDVHDKWLYATIKHVCDNNEGQCFLSTIALAHLSGMSVGKVSNCKQRLQEDGLIFIKSRKQDGDGHAIDCITLTKVLDWGNDDIIQSNKERRDGFVYVLKTANGIFKIGKSRDVDNRIKQLSVGLPHELELICQFVTEDMDSLESALHTKFAEKRIRGEWFRLSAKDTDYLKGLQ